MHRIGIVGCGVAGAATAYLLARDGHRITVLERARELGPFGAGILLQRSGQDVLCHLGILDRTLRRAAPIAELFARHSSGSTLIRTRFDDFAPGTRSYGLHRGVLFEELFELVQTQPIDVRPGCEIVAREDASSSISLVDADGRRHGPFDFVIGADGSRSRLREIGGFQSSVAEYSHGTLWLNAPGEALPSMVSAADKHFATAEPGPGKMLLQVVDRNRRLFGLLPLGDGLVSLYWGVPVREFGRIKSRGLDDLKREIRNFAPESTPVLDSIYDIDQLICTTYRRVCIRQWHAGRVLLIGDAAHAMSPHLGQGINLALVDAWRLAAAIRESETPADAFVRFEKRQRAYVRYYSTIAYLLSPFFQSDWGILGWGRDWALPILPHLPMVRRQMLMTVCGLKGGFLRGRIEV